MTTNTAIDNLTLTTSPKNSWLASLSLEFTLTSSGTQLTRTKHNGPLTVQKAFYPEGRGCAHIYLLHPSAGIVSGDELRMNIQVNEKAHCLVASPDANHFYRAREDLSIGGSKQIQHCVFSLNNMAKCENLPLETIVYEGADGVNTVDVHLKSDCHYLGWDITCLDLARSDKFYKNGNYTQLNRVYCEDKLIYHDSIGIKPSNQHMAGLNNHSVFATFMAYSSKGKFTDIETKTLTSKLRNCMVEAHAEHKMSISQIRQLLIMRYLGEDVKECKILFIQLWQILRPLYLNREANIPRIWHT
jgi:urease accessory protein